MLVYIFISIILKIHFTKKMHKRMYVFFEVDWTKFGPHTILHSLMQMLMPLPEWLRGKWPKSLYRYFSPQD